MAIDPLHTGAAYPTLSLAAIVTLLLLCGGIIHSDVTQRRIPNAYCLAVAGLAVFWWLGLSGWSGLVGLLQQMLVPLLAAIPLLVLFALRVFAGGDVKLLLAMLLWVPMNGISAMLIVMVLGGGVLALALKASSRVFCAVKARTVPYGIPIIAGALLILIPEFRTVLRGVAGSEMGKAVAAGSVVPGSRKPMAAQ